MPVHDVLVIDKGAGVVLFRRSYGSLTSSQMNATAGILSMIMPLVEEIGRTRSGYFSVGRDFITFYNRGDFLFVIYARKELDPAIAEKVSEELAVAFERKFGTSPPAFDVKALREFQQTVDRIVLGSVGLGEFARLDLAKITGVNFVAFYDQKEDQWYVNGNIPAKTITKFCKGLLNKFGDRLRSMASSGAIMKIQSSRGPMILAPVESEGIIFLGIRKEGVDIQSIIQKVEGLRNLGKIRSVSGARSHIPHSIEPEYKALLRIYSLLYSDPEKCLREDIEALRRQGYTLETALRKLRQSAKELM
ncbi:MAG TPA: hypothetical protein ENG61_01770 [Candidatus Korarchaeota archaeon]|nr:MAG: hypothetical protein DRO05_05085 [Candidatus Korarchaeota archaeon]HDD69068.1 hypothetical protein [Candidatus Korarchaeota archaeon]